jgi:menaquinone-dependent protoporphyrinogen oxidase
MIDFNERNAFTNADASSLRIGDSLAGGNARPQETTGGGKRGMKFLVVYGTRNGQTKRIAERIGAQLHARGAMVDLVNARSIPITLQIAAYDGVLAGASVNTGKFQPCLGDFIDGFREEIARVPSAFFSVSLAEADAMRRQQARDYIDHFLTEHEWTPALNASFAGALPPSRFQWLMRLFLRRLAKGTDEFTDWGLVAQFADGFVDKVETPIFAAA